MNVNKKTLLIVALLLACCYSITSQSKVEATDKIVFCPAEDEKQIRKVLRIGKKESIRLNELLLNIQQFGGSYEETFIIKLSRCGKREPEVGEKTVQIFDPGSSSDINDALFHVIVIANDNGSVMEIHSAFQFLAPY